MHYFLHICSLKLYFNRSSTSQISFYSTFKNVFMSLRPLPEDDSIEADILEVTGPESQPGKNWHFYLSDMMGFVLVLNPFLCQKYTLNF